MELSIAEIVRFCKGKAVWQEGCDAEAQISSVVIDSRKAEAGGVFLATVGERVDGHRFISQVFRAGVSLVVTQKTPEQVEKESGEGCSGWGSYVLVEDTLTALKEIAEGYRRKLDIPVIGITGSVGKTSTKEFIAGVLSEKYNVLKTEGNFNNEIGVPLTLLRIRPEHQAAVVEMGISDFGEMHRLSKMVRPNVCVMTNIGQCHLENLKSRDGILRAKSEIFDFMAEDGEICLNGGDDKLRTIREVKGHIPHFFGMGEYAQEEVSAEETRSCGLSGSEAVLHFYGRAGRNGNGAETALPVFVPLPGKHMVRNAAAAACVAGLFGLTPEEIAAGIRKIEPVSGRNHLIVLENYTLIDDCYNANPASMRAALDLLSLADTPRVAILGDMFELGEDSDALHEGVGRYAMETGTDVLICVGEKARQMFYAAADCAEETAHISYFPSLGALLEALEKDFGAYVPAGSTVLIKASHGMQFTKLLTWLQER